MNDDEKEGIYTAFEEQVNMTPTSLKKWLATDDSKKVGWGKEDGNESVGHKSGERIVTILEKKKADLEESDYKHMQKVNSYIKRHTAQKPDGDVSETNWNYSLKNWRHDFAKSSKK